MPDLHDQADRAGAPTAPADLEREWTDRAALARAVAASKSREEAIAIVAAWDAPQAAKREPAPADRETADGARAVAAACHPGPPRLPPKKLSSMPLFERGKTER